MYFLSCNFYKCIFLSNNRYVFGLYTSESRPFVKNFWQINKYKSPKHEKRLKKEREKRNKQATDTEWVKNRSFVRNRQITFIFWEKQKFLYLFLI